LIKKIIITIKSFVFFFILVFDNLNNLYKRLSVLAIEQQQQLINTSNIEPSNTLQSRSSTSTTMSRHESIFYDAPEALSILLLNEDKDEIEKMVKKIFFLFFKLFSLQSDSESSSCADDESHAGDLSRQSAIPPQLSMSIFFHNEFFKKKNFIF
jgi:hypothetical protein